MLALKSSDFYFILSTDLTQWNGKYSSKNMQKFNMVWEKNTAKKNGTISYKCCMAFGYGFFSAVKAYLEVFVFSVWILRSFSHSAILYFLGALKCYFTSFTY